MYLCKKTHIKSRIYKTDKCSGDFSNAKEFLEAITLSGLVLGRSRIKKATCDPMMNQNSIEMRIPVSSGGKMFILQKLAFY